MNWIQNMNRCVGPASWDASKPKEKDMNTQEVPDWMIDATNIPKAEAIFQVSATYDHECQGSYGRLLFVCSAGMLRSATAAYVATLMGYNTRNCGTERYALIPLSANLIYWAQRIYFVNIENFRSALCTFEDEEELITQIRSKSTIWDIPDVYNYRSEKLTQTIKQLLS